ncbi:uncharacterized protein MEPE_04429 [Melanopsichium pennsylvanicum]|uniref:Uncharacterized protein n=2 Tax=Melanopsichium pennsylvanicum TaxID=63383 RepID=A0AAJ4XNT6_9BASI|nr:putative protein [Melanopsichium pennsylvanicum 4]SNX85720.1 uncharacterized protein MEPE_04429 [Melanopsichium pennsylvanicum]
MVFGSRKRRRPDGRTFSPPLAPSPLLTRNLQLLPVGLTQLHNDEHFVSRLRCDIDDLLNTFAEAYLLSLLKRKDLLTDENEAVLSSSLDPPMIAAQQAEQAPSPFSLFCHLWKAKGWHYIQFEFADHNDSKRAMGDAICRVLLEHLSPYVAERNRHLDHHDALPHTISFLNLKVLFKVSAIPFALYLLWATQIYPTSGIGVKHLGPAMERIPIEQDFYDWLLEFPDAVLKHLEEEVRTKSQAETITADIVEVVCRLAGQPLGEDRLDQVGREKAAQAQSSQQRASSRSRKRQARRDDPNAKDALTADGKGPIFDILPVSTLRTRLPRIWPSVRVMSTLEANKEFGRIGSVVRITPREADSDQASGRNTGSKGSESREMVVGLSRGDVIRLKARQRVAMASVDLSKLLGPQVASSATALNTDSQPTKASDLLAQTTDPSAASASCSRTRYEIQTPPWITSSRYTARLRPWMEQECTPMQQSLQRTCQSKERYLEARSKIMPNCTSRDDAQVAERRRDGQGSATQTDFGNWVLQSFRRERKALQEQDTRTSSQDGPSAQVQGTLSTGSQPAVDTEASLSLEQLYRLAAERTKSAAVARGETLRVTRAREFDPG